MKALGLIYVLSLWSGSLCAQLAEPVQFEATTHDFGAIEEKAGVVEHTFNFVNKSNRAITIIQVQASCGCTVPAWSKDPILPGEKGFVQARFDPKGRPGFFSKTLSVTTDWNATPIVLSIRGRVERNALKAREDKYPIAMGNLRLQEQSLNMGNVYINQSPMVKTFTVYNASDKSLNISEVVAPSYLKVAMDNELPPREATTLELTFDGGARNKFGFASESIELHTNDEKQPIKYLPVYANLSEFFPPMSDEELKKAPLLILDSASIHVGTLSANEHASRTIKIRNAGKQDLLIRDVQTNCSCLSASVNKQVIQPGTQAELMLRFGATERVGTTLKAVSIYSNDPLKPALRLAVQAVVKE